MGKSPTIKLERRPLYEESAFDAKETKVLMTVEVTALPKKVQKKLAKLTKTYWSELDEE